MDQSDVQNLARIDFDEVRINALAEVYELLLSLPVNEKAHRHADDMTDGQRETSETRCADILHQNVVSGGGLSNETE